VGFYWKTVNGQQLEGLVFENTIFLVIINEHIRKESHFLLPFEIDNFY
jgi:hypothetical protein